jgi:tetratricopeptide (TPR) repeat protein
VSFQRFLGKCVFTAIFSLCLSLNSFAASDWTSVKSKNFNLAGEASEAELRIVAERLEQFREIFADLFPELNTGSKARANVIIFRDAESFRPFKPKRPDGTADDAIAGYFLAAENVNYITLAMKGGKSDPFHTIFHEYIHFLLKSHTGKYDLPPWLAEGLAQYFETLEVTAEGNVVIGSAPQNRLLTLRRGDLLTDSDLFSAARTAVHGGAGIQRSMFYAQSWLLVHYLLNRGGTMRERLARFLPLISHSGSAANALKQIYGIEPGQVGEALRDYLQLPALPLSMEPMSIKTVARTDGPTVKVTEAMTQAYLGDLLHHMDRLGEAETYLRGAVAADRKLVLANSSLGLLLIRQEKWDEAARFLDIAVAENAADYLVHFNYAYALSRASAPGGMVRRFMPGTFSKMSESLKRSIAIEPGFAQSYRLLGFIYLVNGENLPEAASVLTKGLSLKPGDETFEILLAKALVRLERYSEARGYVERLSQQARDPNVRSDAADMLSTIRQYSKARLEISVPEVNKGTPWSPSLVLLKRSWVSDADLETIERDRENNNLNRILERPKQGEQRLLGTIQRVECSGRDIIYNIRANGENLRLFGESFEDLRMAVIVAGQHTFQLDCGVRLPQSPAVLSFTAALDNQPNLRPRLTSVTFVPENFRLQTQEELAASRQVVVENDLLRRGTASETIEKGAINLDGRWASVKADLRPLNSGEMRMPGTLEYMDCSGNGLSAVATIDGRRQTFTATKDLMPKWFGVEASQISLACGSSPKKLNVLFTYRVLPQEGARGYELLAMEFLPSGFPIQSITGPGR